ncbi:MAG TPA: alpha-L-fucosidase C-terminal domain-containing protein, partial [Limnochordia bacterium]|nr:alpha-L-fucosidase C-terminal domain-containing protein [Limnochordia bacterium]
IYGTRPFVVHGEGISVVDDKNFDVAQIEEQTRQGVFSVQGEMDFTANDLRFTTKGNVLYVIMLGKPEQGVVKIANLRQGEGLASKEIESIGILGGAQCLSWQRNSAHLEIALEGRLPSQYANVLKITYC